MDNLPSPAELHAMPDTYKPPVLSVNNKTGHVMITHEDVGARSKGWTPDIDDISGLRKILNEAGKIKTINGNIVPDQNGNVELTPEKLGAADKEHTHEKLE